MINRYDSRQSRVLPMGGCLVGAQRRKKILLRGLGFPFRFVLGDALV